MTLADLDQSKDKPKITVRFFGEPTILVDGVPFTKWDSQPKILAFYALFHARRTLAQTILEVQAARGGSNEYRPLPIGFTDVDAINAWCLGKQIIQPEGSDDIKFISKLDMVNFLHEGLGSPLRLLHKAGGTYNTSSPNQVHATFYLSPRIQLVEHDVDTFERLSHNARIGNHPDLFADAAQAYPGIFMPGFTSLWAMQIRQQIATTQEGNLLRLANFYKKMQDFDQMQKALEMALDVEDQAGLPSLWNDEANAHFTEVMDDAI